MTRTIAQGSDWLGRLLDVARVTKSASGVAPYPFIKATAGVLVDLLEIVQVIPSSTNCVDPVSQLRAKISECTEEHKGS